MPPGMLSRLAGIREETASICSLIDALAREGNTNSVSERESYAKEIPKEKCKNGFEIHCLFSHILSLSFSRLSRNFRAFRARKLDFKFPSLASTTIKGYGTPNSWL
jgi:hypothetical protein